MIRPISVAIALGLALSQTACLKTRAQLKEDGGMTGDSYSGPGAPTPVKQPPQDVHPQGGYAIDEIKGEMTRLEGRIEDLERAQKDQSANPTLPSKEDFKKLQSRMTELEQAQVNMLEAIKKLQEAPPVPVDPAALLEKAHHQMEAGNFEGAVETLGACIKIAKGKRAEDCTFSRGESHYALKNYKKAIVDFSKFPEKYTHSNYMAKALYKIGLSFDALGMKEDAKGFYQELIEKHPKSPEARKARSKVR